MRVRLLEASCLQVQVCCLSCLSPVPQVASKTTFFERRCHMYSLNDTDGELIPFCTNLLASRGITNVGAPASQFTAQLGQQYAGISQSVLDQCLVEQRFARGAQLRTLIYNQVRLGFVVLL